MEPSPAAPTKRHIVFGTAGHIDHGKSALIKSLTGTDPDRLKEEKERGMTTDLGFAFLGDDITIIDVPGHEKFVRHMLSGASTIDFVMMVIAADDGIMPQTLEHFDILKLLDIKNGVIVVTKKDLVEEDHLAVVIDDIKTMTQHTFLENAPIIPVSNSTQEGIEDLKKVLTELISEIETKPDRGIFRMPIDRCFTIKGFGTVVAGTVLSGKVKIGDLVELLPQKKEVKVRGIEVHNKKVSEVGTGFRAAINLAGAEKEEIERGCVIAQPGYFEPSQYLNASLYLLTVAEKPLKNLTRLRIHLGTKEMLGRVAILDKKVIEPGDKAMVQYRLESPEVCDIGDRYVIRTYSPQMTIGGGVIIEPKAVKAKGFDEQLIEHLRRIEERDPKIMVEEHLAGNFELPQKLEEIGIDLNLLKADVQRLINELTAENKVLCTDGKRGLYYARVNLDKLKDRIVSFLKEFHKNNSTLVGVPRTEMISQIGRGMDTSLVAYAFESMARENLIKLSADNKISLFEYNVILDKNLTDLVNKIENIVLGGAFKPPDFSDPGIQSLGTADLLKKAYRHLIDSGKLILLAEGVALHRTMVTQAKEKLIQFLTANKQIRVSEFRDLLGDTSRKYVLPLLIYFDTNKITIKRGDVRVLGPKA